MSQLRISAKNLGAMALPDFCPRCFWLKMHIKNMPFQIFPGIFSSIDAYTKKVAHAWIDGIKGPMPQFMIDLGVSAWIKTPHWSKFYREHEETGITLSGVPDDFWVVGDGLHIPDYKTAKYTKNQDKLLPMYVVQENGYGWIASGQGRNVSGLSLIYMEPVTTEEAAARGAGEGLFTMEFTPHYVPVDMDFGMLFPLFEKARKLYDGPIPNGLEGCKDCAALNGITEAIAA